MSYIRWSEIFELEARQIYLVRFWVFAVNWTISSPFYLYSLKSQSLCLSGLYSTVGSRVSNMLCPESLDSSEERLASTWRSTAFLLNKAFVLSIFTATDCNKTAFLGFKIVICEVLRAKCHRWSFLTLWLMYGKVLQSQMAACEGRHEPWALVLFGSSDDSY